MSDSTPSIDTYGWHTVSAITYAEVNKAIAKAGSFPKSFAQSDGDFSINGTFGSWTLATGGAGQLLAMAVTISGGTYTLAGKTNSLNPCTVTMQVQSKFIPQPKTSTTDLKLASDKPVNILASLPAQATFPIDAAFRDVIRDWLVANLSQFNVIFASVDLDADFDQAPGLSWLTPSWLGYAVAEPQSGATMDNSVFAVLCLIDSTKPSAELVQQVSPYAIPAGCKASFLLSPAKVLQHMFLASLPIMFSGTQNVDPNTSFEIYSDGTAIRNIKSLQLGKFTLENGKEVEPTVDANNFTMTIAGTDIKIEIAEMEFEYSPGISVHLTYSGRCHLAYDSAKQILTLPIAQQTNTATVIPSQGIAITEIVTGAVAGLLAAFAGASGFVAKAADAAITEAKIAGMGVQIEMTSVQGSVSVGAADAGAIQVSALRGYLAGTVDEVSAIAGKAKLFGGIAAGVGFCCGSFPTVIEAMKKIAKGEYDSMPKITELTQAAIGKTVIWPSQVGVYKLDSAQLNQALQFGLK